MTSPFRLAPPRSHALALIDRPRLLDPLQARFERRLTVLRAGAGFGKTALLMQALESNAEDSGGIDVWLSCGSQDRRRESLSAALLHAFGADPLTTDPVGAIADAVWKQSPLEVALLIDDVHAIGEESSSSAALLSQLVEELPANAHLVLASRIALPFSIARLVSQGEALLLEEKELAFQEEERARFLALRRVEADPRQTPEWPAILELSVGAGEPFVSDYLMEEVLRRLDPAHRRALARMSPLDWIDADRIEAFTGSRRDPRTLTHPLSLTTFDEAGAARIHGLWSTLLGTLDPEWSEQELARACQHLVAEGAYREAILLELANQGEEKIDPILDHLIRGAWTQLDPSELQTILSLLPPTVQNTSAADLLEALLQMRRNPSRARTKLEAALARIRAEGNVARELAGGFALAMVDFWCGDAEGLERASLRATELGLDLVGDAAMANADLLRGHPERALEKLEKVRAAGQEGEFVMLNLAMTLLDLGQPERTIEELEPILDSEATLHRGALFAAMHDAKWLAGRLPAAEILCHDDGFGIEVAGHAHNAVTFLSILAFQNAVLGRQTVGLRHHDRARALFDTSFGDRAEIAVVMARVALHCAAGEEEAAATLVDQCFTHRDPECLPQRHTFRCLPMALVLSKRARAVSADWHIGPAFQPGLDAAHAIISAREDHALAPAQALDWRQPERFSQAFAPPLLLELCLLGAAAGIEVAADRVEPLALKERSTLRRLRNHPIEAVSLQAKSLIERIPERPKEKLLLRTLGPLKIYRDGVEVESNALRRGRVRDILQYLIAHRRVERSDLALALWPDLADAAPLNNLRVNLNHLHKLLEPNRQKGEPSFYLRTRGDTLSLYTGDGLDIDADEFTRQMAEGETAENAGAIAIALERYERALALYQGPFLADVAEPRWADSDRIRLESDFLRIAVRAAELELGRGEIERSLDFADRAIAVDETNEAAHRARAHAFLRRRHRGNARQVMSGLLETLAQAGLRPEKASLELARRVGIDL